MASELSINELLEETKASLIPLTVLRLTGVPSTNQESDVEWETQTWKTTAYVTCFKLVSFLFTFQLSTYIHGL